MIEFLVHDAERSFGEGGKVAKLSFWSYKVMTRAYLPSYQNPPVFPKKSPGPPANFIIQDAYVDYCAWHRYSDFEWLLERLHADYPGEIFPPIPEKDSDATTDKLKDLFSGGNENDVSSRHPHVMRRIRRLQLFLNYIAEKKCLYENTHLKAFICMEEAEWVAYKEEVNRAVKPSGWGALRAKAGSLFQSAKRASGNTAQHFDDASNIGRVRVLQHRFADSLMVCMRQVVNMVRTAHTDKLAVNIDDVIAQNAGRPLPPTLIYNGHIVRDAVHDHGIVKHTDGNTAYVSWGDDGKSVEATDMFSLQYPPSGIADPALFAVQEMITQIDSFFHYIHFRNESTKMERLVDQLWFWASYAAAVESVINSIEAIERERQEVLEVAAKEKKADKRAQLEQKAGELATKFAAASAAFENDYAFRYRQLQSKALLQILTLFGELSVTLMNDEDWGQRMQRADASLPLIFDVPPEVQQLLAQGSGTATSAAGGATTQSKDAGPLPPPPHQHRPAAPPVAAGNANAVPSPGPAPSVYGAADSSSTAVAAKHTDPFRVETPPPQEAPPPPPRKPDWGPQPTAPAEADDVPPPPPPPPATGAAGAVEAAVDNDQPGESPMLDPAWQAQAGGPSSGRHELPSPTSDGDEPPPLPPS